jgi:tetratricopeptide (TPR) repeat protein
MNRKNRILAFTVMLASTLTAAPPAGSQMVQTWNIQARNQAERGVSAGVTLLTRRNIVLAIRAFEQATQTDPNDADPFAMLGMALAMQGRYEEALHALQRSYSLQQTSETLNDTGWVYYLQHDYDAAITSWNRALELNPKLCQIYGNIGFALLRKGQFSDADAQFRKLVKCRPQSNYGYQGIALIHYLRGNFSQARAAAERAQLTSFYAPVTLLLAKIDALQGDKVSAAKRALVYSALVRRRNLPDRAMTEIGLPVQHDFHWDPLRVDGYDNGFLLAARLQDPLNEKKRIAFARLGNAESAIASVRTALANAPNDLILLRELGLAQMANGDYAGATESFKKVLDVCPHCYVELLHVARSLAFEGKGAEGAAYVREFQSKVPGQQISPAYLSIGQEPPPQPVQEASPKKKVREPKPRKEPRATSNPQTIPASDF